MKSIFKDSDGFKMQLTMAMIVAGVVIAAPSLAGVVTSTADAGPGTLRQEIIDANADSAPTQITFDPTLFPATITLTTRLPAMTDAGDSIDTTGLVVAIDGNAVPDAPDQHAIGIRVMASNVTVNGLTLQNFAHDGIYVGPSATGSGVLISQVKVSDNVLINNLDGIHVSGRTGPNNVVEATIYNNVLFGNQDDGITVEGSQDGTPGQNEIQVHMEKNVIVGSLGQTSGGTRTGDGIRVLGGTGDGSDNRIIADIIENSIWDNGDDGIVVAGAGGAAASNNTIETTILSNTIKDNGLPASINGNGIVIRGGSNNGATSGGNNNSVLFQVNGNYSVGSKDTGIVVNGGLGTGNSLQGTLDFNYAVGNGLDGLRIHGGSGSNNQLVDITVEGNQLVTNTRDGIRVDGGSGSSNLLQNLLLATNQVVLNNGFGIQITLGGGSGSTVSLGGIAKNQLIANNGDGLFVGSGVLGSGSIVVDFNLSAANSEDGIDIESVGYRLTNNLTFYNIFDGISAIGNTDGGGNIGLLNGACNTPGCY